MKKNVFFKSICVVLAVFCMAFYATKIIKVDTSASYLQYSLDHPLHKTVSKAQNFACAINYDEASKSILQVSVNAPVRNFNSGNSSRDAHALEVIEAIKYPSVKFSSTKITPIKDNQFSVTGTLNFHGMTKPVMFTIAQTETDKSIFVKGGFTAKLSEFKVERPAVLGLAVGDDMKIEFQTSFPK